MPPSSTPVHRLAKGQTGNLALAHALDRDGYTLAAQGRSFNLAKVYFAQHVGSAARLQVAAKRTVAQQATVARSPSRSKSSYAYNVALEQDPKAVLQTGPGVPSWTWPQTRTRVRFS